MLRLLVAIWLYALAVAAVNADAAPMCSAVSKPRPYTMCSRMLGVIPNTFGKDEGQARAVLRAAGFYKVAVHQSTSGAAPPSHATGTNPRHGVHALFTEVVVLYLAPRNPPPPGSSLHNFLGGTSRTAVETAKRLLPASITTQLLSCRRSIGIGQDPDQHLRVSGQEPPEHTPVNASLKQLVLHLSPGSAFMDKLKGIDVALARQEVAKTPALNMYWKLNLHSTDVTPDRPAGQVVAAWIDSGPCLIHLLVAAEAPIPRTPPPCASVCPSPPPPDPPSGPMLPALGGALAALVATRALLSRRAADDLTPEGPDAGTAAPPSPHNPLRVRPDVPRGAPSPSP